ncbi:MAG: GatB/YqeY domain-containing protein [Syntrophales bacterium]|nr:GatB/YqeY domain-containing protein [Syntrophales bacterium]
MTIDERVESEMKEAARARDKVRLSTLRLVKSAFHNREIDLKKKLDEREMLQVLSSMAKQRNDSIEQFERGGRRDLVDREAQELAIIKTFMPEEMSEEEIRAAISRAIEAAGATGIRDMGAVMKLLIPVITGKADGKRVSEMVKDTLSS